MTSQDEEELQRLTGILESVDSKMDSDAVAHEALRKAAVALIVAFNRGLRSEVESRFLEIEQPLTDLEREQLRSLGIEAD
jgi:hypothetical protein